MVNIQSIKKDKKNNKKENSEIVFFSILSILFFVASAYGVQRTILSTVAGKNIPLNSWFETGAWISVAFILSGLGLFKAFSGFFTGIYAQKIGTQNIVTIGISCFIVGLFPLLFSQGNPILLGIGNSFIGAGEGILYAGSMTYISDLSFPKRRAQWLGIMEMSVYAGYSFGAITAGFVTTLTESYIMPFIFSIIIAFVGLGVSLITIKPIKVTKTQKMMNEFFNSIKEPVIPSSFKKIVTRPTMIVTLLNGHISKMVDSIIVLFLPLLLSYEFYGYGFSIEQTGMITAIFTLTWALTMPFAGQVSDWIGRKRPIFLGLIIEMIAIFSIQSSPSPFFIIFLLSALGGIGVGLYYPILPTISVDVAPDAEKSKLIGIYRAIKDLGYFTGPLVAGIITQIWYNTDTRLNIILRVPLSVACFLLLIGSLSVLLVRETHPGWAQFQASVQHANIVKECVIQATKGLLIYLEQSSIDDSEFILKLAKYSLRAKELEVQADKNLEEIVGQTYKAFHNSPDASNFLRIARRLDRAAGLTLGALFRIQLISIEEIPPLIQEKLHNASFALRSMILTAVNVLQVLEIKLDAVSGMYNSVRENERELDLLYRMMNRQLFLSAHEMHYSTWNAIRDVINMIEQAADSTEDAVEVINILSIKYKT